MQLTINAQQLFNLVSHFEQMAGTIFLYSGEEGLSYLALFPTTILRAKGDQQSKVQGKDFFLLNKQNPWEGLQALLTAPSQSEGVWPEWMGYFNYEMGAASNPEKKIEIPFAGEAYLQKSAVLLKFDPKKNCAEIQFDKSCWEDLSSEQKLWVEKLADPAAWKKLFQPNYPLAISKAGACYPLETKKDYLAKIGEIQAQIAAGNVYQVNLSQAFRIENFINPYPFFCKLMEINSVPFAAYLRLEKKVIISASPERLLSKKEGIIETNPIKGTAPRGKTSEEDDAQRITLQNSEKNRAELLMIVDLMRNDLGKICLPGSVNVKEIYGLKTYPHLYHTQARIIGMPLPELTSLELLRACFPAGSISGCPKLSAQQIIFDLEKRARRSYTGAIGYIASNGDFDWNIAIRTLEIENDEGLIQLGGAVVCDSDPEQEYQETLLKGKPLFEAMGIA